MTNSRAAQITLAETTSHAVTVDQTQKLDSTSDSLASTVRPTLSMDLRLRLLHRNQIAFGPGKAQLLQAIAQTGSISQAAKQMGMSYRRAWQLVDTMNHCFVQPLVETQTGGRQGGGTVVTEFGLQVLYLFNETIEMLHQQANAYQQQFDVLLR